MAKTPKISKMRFDTSYKRLLLSIFAPEVVEQVLKQLSRKERVAQVGFGDTKLTIVKDEQIEQARLDPDTNFLLDLAMKAHVAHIQATRHISGEDGLVDEILKLRATALLMKEKAAKAKMAAGTAGSPMANEVEDKLNRALEKLASLLTRAEKLSVVHLKQLGGKIRNKVADFAQEWEDFTREQREELIRFMKENNLPLGQTQEENLRKIEPMADIINDYTERKLELPSDVRN